MISFIDAACRVTAFQAVQVSIFIRSTDVALKTEKIRQPLGLSASHRGRENAPVKRHRKSHRPGELPNKPVRCHHHRRFAGLIVIKHPKRGRDTHVKVQNRLLLYRFPIDRKALEICTAAILCTYFSCVFALSSGQALGPFSIGKRPIASKCTCNQRPFVRGFHATRSYSQWCMSGAKIRCVSC